MEPWKQLLDYWRSKHIDGKPPARADLDPVIEIPRLVANMLILEYDGDGYIYRLAGSEVVAQAGFDMTGHRVGYSGVNANTLPKWLQTPSVADAIILEWRSRVFRFSRLWGRWSEEAGLTGCRFTAMLSR